MYWACDVIVWRVRTCFDVFWQLSGHGDIAQVLASFTIVTRIRLRVNFIHTLITAPLRLRSSISRENSSGKKEVEKSAFQGQKIDPPISKKVEERHLEKDESLEI